MKNIRVFYLKIWRWNFLYFIYRHVFVMIKWKPFSTYKIASALSGDSNQPPHPLSLISFLAGHCVGGQWSKASSYRHRRLWSDWADAILQFARLSCGSSSNGSWLSQLATRRTAVISLSVSVSSSTWHLIQELRKHAYSNIKKIAPPKSETFQVKNSNIFHISVQNMIVGTR